MLNPHTNIGCPRCGSDTIIETTQMGFGFPLEHFALCCACGLSREECYVSFEHGRATIELPPPNAAVSLILTDNEWKRIDTGAPSP